MSQLPQKIYTAAQVRELDRIAIDEHGILGFSLMQRAGEAAFEVILQQWPECTDVAVLCGMGNNGGDGFIVASLAKKQGLQVTVLVMGEPESLKGDARRAWNVMVQNGITTAAYTGQLLDQHELIVDAILGTGSKGPLSGKWAEAVIAINASPASVISMDVPTGVHPDTGEVMGVAVEADCTVSFIGMKQGLVTGEGGARAGKLFFSDLGVPAAIFGGVDSAVHRLEYQQLKGYLSRRSSSAHKGNYGHVLIVGGNSGMSGAALLAGEAALRVGAGIVSIATHPDHAAQLNLNRPELMVHGIQETSQLAALLKRATVVVVGPGLGTDSWSKALFSRVLESSLPMVVDADALTLLANDPVSRQNWILTPHPGEAGRLLGGDAKTVQVDRYKSIRELEHGYQGCIVLKGNGSLVYDGEQLAVCTDGNPGMASGGMGDVLSGIIAGLRAQHHTMDIAAKLGVVLHAKSADRAVTAGQRGLLASDLFPHIRQLANPQ